MRDGQHPELLLPEALTEYDGRLQFFSLDLEILIAAPPISLAP